MEAFKASSISTAGGNCSFSPSLQVLQEWDFCLRLETYDCMFKPILDKFGRDTKSTLSHLLTVHNETCGCHIDCCAAEMNKVWNQKKLPFMEMHKLSGLAFEDFLSRVLRLLLNNSIMDVEPLNESDFWLFLRQPPNYNHHHHHNVVQVLQQQQQSVTPIKAVGGVGGGGGPTIDDEELADIQNFILNDIVDVNQKLQQQQQQPSSSAAAEEEQEDMIVQPFIDPSDELARLKRKEKHMAPIDCTGVSAAFGLTWFCKHCQLTHAAKQDCDHYRNIHDYKHVLPNSPSSTSGLPPELIRRSDGFVYTRKAMKAYTRLGPLEGVALEESKMDFDEDRSHVWLLHRENGSRKCISTADEATSNWIRNVSPSEAACDANVLAVTDSMDDKLYLVTTVDLGPDTMLKYFAKEDPTVEFWTSWTNAWANQRRCSRCSVHGQFDSVADYRTHIALWHDLSFQGNPQNRIYYCPDCNEKRIGAKDIVRHCRDEHRSLPFQCRHCSKRFETYNSLVKHKNRIHCEEKPLRKTCEKCGKVYLDPKALKQHVRQVHERSEQLHCNKCERILSSKYALNRHVKEVHQRQQEHICHKCKKHFTQQSNLKQHMLIHLGVKPFTCQHGTCKSAFTTKQTLQVHYRKVHHYTDLNMPPVVKKPTVSNLQLLEECIKHDDDDDSAQSSSNNSLDTSSEFESGTSMVEGSSIEPTASTAVAATTSMLQFISRVNNHHHHQQPPHHNGGHVHQQHHHNQLYHNSNNVYQYHFQHGK